MTLIDNLKKLSIRDNRKNWDIAYPLSNGRWVQRERVTPRDCIMLIAAAMELCGTLRLRERGSGRVYRVDGQKKIILETS